MAPTPKDNSVAQAGKALNSAGLLKDLIGTAIITFLILTPIVAMKTTMAQGVLTISYRFLMVLVLTAIVVGVRLFLHLFVWNRSESGRSSKALAKQWLALFSVSRWK